MRNIITGYTDLSLCVILLHGLHTCYYAQYYYWLYRPVIMRNFNTGCTALSLYAQYYYLAYRPAIIRNINTRYTDLSLCVILLLGLQTRYYAQYNYWVYRHVIMRNFNTGCYYYYLVYRHVIIHNINTRYTNGVSSLTRVRFLTPFLQHERSK